MFMFKPKWLPCMNLCHYRALLQGLSVLVDIEQPVLDNKVYNICPAYTLSILLFMMSSCRSTKENKYQLWVSKVIWQLHIAGSSETNFHLLGNLYSHHDYHESTPLGSSISQLSSCHMFIKYFC
jgi:hypothetical protein